MAIHFKKQPPFFSYSQIAPFSTFIQRKQTQNFKEIQYLATAHTRKIMQYTPRRPSQTHTQKRISKNPHCKKGHL